MRQLAVALALLGAATTPAAAQLLLPGGEARAAGSLNLILPAGSARATGMGSAFTAVAGDPAASAWNPAGLATLARPEVTVAYDQYVLELEHAPFAVRGTAAGFTLEESIEARAHGDYSHVGFATITLPIAGIVTQVTYRKLSTIPELRSEIAGTRTVAGPDGTIASGPYESRTELIPAGDVYDWGVSAARRFGRLSLGATANLLDSDIESHFASRDGDSVRTEAYAFEFHGLHVDVGALVDLSNRWTIGGVWRSGFGADVKTTFESTANGESERARAASSIAWPDGWAAGIAFRPRGALLVAADYDVTRWSAATIENLPCRDCPPQGVAPFPALFLGEQGDETKARLGAEWTLSVADGELRLPLRAGIFRETRAASLYGAEAPAPEYDGWSAGGGTAFDHVRIDLAFVHREATESAPPATAAWPVPAAGGAAVAVAVPVRSVDVSGDRILLTLAVSF